MMARKAIRLGWIPRPPLPQSALSPPGSTVQLEPLAQEQLPIDQGAAADG